MFTILRQRDFGLVWTSALISQLGDWVLIAALPFYVYATTGSTLASARPSWLAVCRPPLRLFAGVFVDRDRKRLIVIGERRSRAAPAASCTADTLWIVYVVAFVESTIAVFSSRRSARRYPRSLARGSSFANPPLRNVARLIGPPVAGFMLALSLPGVVVVDAALFISVQLARISVRYASPLLPLRLPGPPARFRRSGASGVRPVSGERWIAILRRPSDLAARRCVHRRSRGVRAGVPAARRWSLAGF
jgi:hypothetical protein